MTRTADLLFDCCIKDIYPPINVSVDYFGDTWENDEHESIVLGVYQGLVRRDRVSSDELHRHFLQNTLDDLIHSKYKGRETGYYKKFCNLKLNLETITSPNLNVIQ